MSNEEGVRSGTASAKNGIFTIKAKPIDKTPPASIINPQAIAGSTYINFTWTNPSDPDYHHVMLFLNGTFLTNITTPQNYHNVTGLTPDTEYQLGTHTVDSSGNINETWVNATARTLPSGAVPPVAECGEEKLGCENVGAKVQFNGSASYDPDGAIVSYYWEFGDGSTGLGVAPNHTYAAYMWNGTAYQPFIVNLTVTDDSGITNRTSLNVTIWIAGDANGDGKVNILDASVVGLKGNGNDPCADLNNDGKVNILDASIIGLNWGKIA